MSPSRDLSPQQARGRGNGAPGCHVGGRREADEAAIENTQVQLDTRTVTAPIEGMTGIRMVDVGNVNLAIRPGPLSWIYAEFKNRLRVIFYIARGYGRG